MGNKSCQEIFVDIGFGCCVVVVMVKCIEVLMSGCDVDDDLLKFEWYFVYYVLLVVIIGIEGMFVQLFVCCWLILGDVIMGYIGIGLGMVIYMMDCWVVQCIYCCDLGCWIDVEWVLQLGCLFDVVVKVFVKNMKGIFVCVVVDIMLVDVNIVYIVMDEDLMYELMVLCFVIQVSDCVYFVNVMWCVRINLDVMWIMCECWIDDGVYVCYDGGM